VSDYRDTAGVVRRLSINLAHRQRIKQQLGYDLVAMAHDPGQLQTLLTALQTEDALLYQLIGIICGEDPEQLMATADGTVHEAAASAFLEALTSFFPVGSPLRLPLENLWRELRAQQAAAQQAAEEAMLQAVQSVLTGLEMSTSTTSTSGSGDWQQSPQATG
jgi:hypothetical protein